MTELKLVPSETEKQLRLMRAAPAMRDAAKRLLLTHGCSLGDPEPLCADCRDMREAIALAERGE